MGAAPSTLTHVLGMNSPEGIRAYNNEARQIVPVDAPTVCAATARGTIATDVARVAAGGKPGAGTLKQSQDWGRPGVPLTVGDGDETWVHQLPPRMAENLFAATTTLPTGDGLPEYAALRTQASVQTIVSVLKGKAPTVGGQPLRDGQILFMAETFIHRRWAAHIWALADNEPDGELADNLRYQALTADQVQLVAEPGAGKTAAALASLRPALSHGAVTGTESDDVGAALVLTSSSAAPVWELENARVTVGNSPAQNFAGIINTLDQPLISSGYQLNVMTLGALKLIAQGYGNLDKLYRDINRCIDDRETAEAMRNSPYPYASALANIFSFVSDPKNVLIVDDLGVKLACPQLRWLYDASFCKCMIMTLNATPTGHTNTACLKNMHQAARGNPESMRRLAQAAMEEGAGAARDPVTRARAMAAANVPAQGFPTEREFEAALRNQSVRAGAALAAAADDGEDLEQNILTWFARVNATQSYLPPARGEDAALLEAVTTEFAALAAKLPLLPPGWTADKAARDALKGAPPVFALLVPDDGEKLATFDMTKYTNEWKDNARMPRACAVGAIAKLAADVVGGLGRGTRGAVLANSPDVVKECMDQVKAQSSGMFHDQNTDGIYGDAPVPGRKRTIAAAQARSDAADDGFVGASIGAAGVAVDLGHGCVSILAHPLFLPSAIVQAARRVRGYSPVFIALRQGSLDWVVLARAAAIGEIMGIVRSMCVDRAKVWARVDVVQMIKQGRVAP